MAIDVALRHRTAYHYDQLVQLGPQVIRLRPAPHCRTRVLSYSLRVKPEPHFLNWQQDPQGNYLARLVFPERTREFSDRRRSDRRNGGVQPVRLLPRAGSGDISVCLRVVAQQRAGALPATVAAGSAAVGVAPSIQRDPENRTIDFLVASQSSAAAADRLRYPHWSRGSRPARRRWRAAAVRAATPAGCWCRSCGIWVSPPASSPAT